MSSDRWSGGAGADAIFSSRTGRWTKHGAEAGASWSANAAVKAEVRLHSV